MKSKIILKKEKEKSLIRRHPWVFSGAIDTFGDNFENGDLCSVYSQDKILLGHGYFNKNCSLCGRMISFKDDDPYLTIEKNIENAIFLRKRFFSDNTTNAYRLINSEGDLLPGLIVDYYDNYLVLQINSLGMEKLKAFVVKILLKNLPNLKGIYEKSISSVRKKEGLEDSSSLLFGSLPKEMIVLENSHKFIFDPINGQKTAFFLDQRNMRKFLGSICENKKVLNCFSYHNGFGVYALKNNAKAVDSVEISAKANINGKKNLLINNLKEQNFFEEDVFDFLIRSELDYDIIVLDPPAFIKKQKDLKNGINAYKKLHSLVFQKALRRTVLITSSCSYYFDKELFQKTIFQAALENNRNVKIISHHIDAPDHPINIYHPEMDYLKSFVLFID